MQLREKVILITGASSGIGEELARQLAKENCRLALLARRYEKLESLKSELAGTGAEIDIYKCDVSIQSEVKLTVKKILEKFGEVNLAILNSGVGLKDSGDDFDSSAARKTFETNVLGMAYFFEELLPGFKKRKSGTIVGVSSLADGRGFPGNGIYCASKAAATLFLESQRVGLKKYGIKVITVKPGFVRTPMTAKNRFPMPFLMNADKAAEIIIRGIKKEKDVIQFPWQTALGAKFLRIIPDSLFNYVALKNTK